MLQVKHVSSLSPYPTANKTKSVRPNSTWSPGFFPTLSSYIYSNQRKHNVMRQLTSIQCSESTIETNAEPRSLRQAKPRQSKASESRQDRHDNAENTRRRSGSTNMSIRGFDMQGLHTLCCENIGLDHESCVPM